MLESLRKAGVLRRAYAAGAALALLLRTLVPVGFMVGQVEGRAALVPCTAYELPQAHMPLSQAAHHHHHDGSAHGDHAEHAQAPCPYAAALGAMPGAPAVATIGKVHLGPAALRTGLHDSLPTAPPPRFRAPRGPPAYA